MVTTWQLDSWTVEEPGSGGGEVAEQITQVKYKITLPLQNILINKVQFKLRSLPVHGCIVRRWAPGRRQVEAPAHPSSTGARRRVSLHTVCLCGHCASLWSFPVSLWSLCLFISQLHTCKVVCGCFSHGCSAFAFAKSDGHIAHLAKALKPAAVVRLHSPVAHFGTLHFDLYKIHVKFPDCILHGRLWLTDTCQQTDTQRRCK